MLLHQLPVESSTKQRLLGDLAGWDLHSILLADLFHAFTGKPHPRRPEPQKRSRYAEARKRLEEQRARLASQSQ